MFSRDMMRAIPGAQAPGGDWGIAAPVRPGRDGRLFEGIERSQTSASNADFKKIYDSQMACRDDGNLWWQVAEYSYETFMIRTRPKSGNT
jgi:hypothetical protein